MKEFAFRSQARLVIACATCLVFTLAFAATPTSEMIDQSVRRAMEAFDAPGVTVAVVYDGEVYYAAGHGVVEAGSSKQVDDETLFHIGSVSKAFTAAALAILADEGKLAWDDQVIDYLPEFRMHDPWVTREFTIRDLLTHRSGLPLGAGDLLMFPDATSTPADIIRGLRYLEPATSFRSEFAYDNLLYVVAGELVARVSGMPFESFLEQRLLEPLGMTDCAATVGRAARGADIATPHMLVNGELQTTGTGMTDLVAAAGGIVCSARGMAHWMLFVLNEGETGDGRRLISEEQFAELIKPATLRATPGVFAKYAGAYLSAYALGWGVSTFYGQPMLSHSGGVLGMTTYLAVLPRQNLAVFASNNQMSSAAAAVVNDIVDQFLRDAGQGVGQDWIALLGQATAERQAAADEAVAAAWASRNADSRPSLPLDAYAGTYRDAWYGDIRISVQDGTLWFYSGRSEPLRGPLEHFQYDTFVARWSDRRLMADAYVSFVLSPEGRVERIRMKAESPATDFSFDFHDLDLQRVD
ncbi:MAG: serine hydrolase [Gammaproteobacteria bacterium]|nr:serine hydrolase [Gammaproteobacteria bacterium]MDH4256745.1 serine hydrolase [Gammaproteobacteria bacterium]MDH5311172.1 serine hydrolase [Gammaproteobacteria bacterium]